MISEKAPRSPRKTNQVLFKVLRDATKPEIKAAVELLFKVEVEAVQVANVKGKDKRFGKLSAGATTGRRPMCALKPGQEINFPGRPRKSWQSSRSNPPPPAVAPS